MVAHVSQKAGTHLCWLHVQISINPTYRMIGKHAVAIGKDVIAVDKTGKVKFNSDIT